MKAILNQKVYVDTMGLPKELALLAEPEPQKDGTNHWFWPRGMVIEGDAGTFAGIKAVHLSGTGQADPADDETIAIIGRTPEEQNAQRVRSEMAAKGIWDKGDRELYMAGVILGYDADLKSIPGPNWDAYHAAREQAQTQTKTEEI